MSAVSAAASGVSPTVWTGPRRRSLQSLHALIVAVAAFFAAASTTQAIEIGKPAPAFELPSPGSAARISLGQYKGKVVFVDFWASWCGPCRQSLPLYEKLHAELAHEDFAILAINLDENAADAQAFLAQHPVSYTILSDPEGDVPKSFGLVGMPSSYLIDRDGILRAVHTGFDPADIAKLRAEIEGLLGKHDAAH